MQRQMRRRRRHSQRLEDWQAIEGREAEEVETELDEEEEIGEEQEREQRPTLYGALQREARLRRQEREERVWANLERAGLL